MNKHIEQFLAQDRDNLLGHVCETIPRNRLTLPAPDHVGRVFGPGDRPTPVLVNLERLFSHGRIGGSGYLSILPVDHGVEHGAGADFAVNPIYFDPVNIARLAVEGGCNALASTLGVLGMIARSHAHRIPLIAKINHNELLSHPNRYDQILFGNVRQAREMGAAGVGATIYFGSPESRRQIQEISEAFSEAHRLGLFTVLWCYVRNKAFKVDGTDHQTSADLTGQANHLGATIEADIIKQKQPTSNGGFKAIEDFGKSDPLMYERLTSNHPIDLTRYQVANNYMGRVSLINSGGASSGGSDFDQAIRTAIVNKRAGGTGLILGRKAFQRPFEEGVALIHAVQDVYANSEINVA